MTYRPITDIWILGRSKVRYYGAYPGGFLERARALLGVSIDDAVLHVCSGQVQHYPYRGLGRHDRTIDLDPSLEPHFVGDVREGLPLDGARGWAAILADPPYTEDDAAHYVPGPDHFPKPANLLATCLRTVRPGGRVGMLHYEWPRPPAMLDRHPIRCVALIGVINGYANRMRAFSVFEKVKL